MSWYSFFYYDGIPTFFLWACLVVALIIRRTKLTWLVLLTSPFLPAILYSFSYGIYSYCAGKAAYKEYGLPTSEFYNLDSSIRVWNQSKGCMVDGTEIFTQTPNNLAIEWCTKIFGVQRGVYKGYYPAKDVAFEAIDNGQIVQFTSKAVDTLIDRQCVDSISFILNHQHFWLTSYYRPLYFKEGMGNAKAVVLNGECLLFHPAFDTTFGTVYLADKSTGRVFALYTKIPTR